MRRTSAEIVELPVAHSRRVYLLEYELPLHFHVEARPLFVLLRNGGEPSGINRTYRLYREEGLTVRKRRARRRAVGTRAPILVEAVANARWSLYFVHDHLPAAGGTGSSTLSTT